MGSAHILPRISSRNGAPSSANHSLGASRSSGWKVSAALAALAPVMRTGRVRHDLPNKAERDSCCRDQVPCDGLLRNKKKLHAGRATRKARTSSLMTDMVCKGLAQIGQLA